ncbi:MAG: hypothetical protein AAEC86_11810, partial [Pseudohongiellaceae bacterium]
MTQYQQQLMDYLPPAMRNFLKGSPKGELLKKVDATLLVFDQYVVHVESGLSNQFQETAGDLDPNRLAIACKHLLAEQQKEPSVLLLFPPDEFVATRQVMPGIGKDNLVSAMELQSENLLPTFTDSVALAVNPESADGGVEHIALWITNERLTQLFDAFQQQDIFLVAIKPRLLNIEGTSTDCFVDEDQNCVTAVNVIDGVISNWWHVNKLDFENESYVQQWQQVVENNALRTSEYTSSKAYLSGSNNHCNQVYTFFPSGALSARRRVERGRKLLIGASVVASLLLLSVIPFVGQSIERTSLVASLEAQRALSSGARQDQLVVINFENEWGPINDFPVQQIRESMFTLQSVLSPDRLSSL